MSLIVLKDRGGQSLRIHQVGDVRMTPAFPVDVLPEITKLQMRDEDIVIAAWMRSGTHWMWEMTQMLINNNAETIPKKKEVHMFESSPISILDGLPSPRIFNTHLHFNHLPEGLKTKRCKVIYLLRDPRDATVSWYRFQTMHIPSGYKGEWHNWLPLQLEGELDWGSWFDHVRDWENVFETHPNLDVHFWFYEDMKRNPVEELRKVKEFLGTSTSEDLLKAIVEKCQLARMRADKYEYEWPNKGLNTHYMKGRVGAWKDVFTVKQYEEFEKLYREKMAGSNFEERYKGQADMF